MFLFKTSITYTDKNKLFKEFREFIEGYDNFIIKTKEDKKAFKNLLKKKAEDLHKKHSRCKPIQIHYLNDYKNIESVFVPGSWSADIFQVKGFYTPSD